MKTSTICLILIINFTQALIGQNTDIENTISVKIVVPVIIEKIEETDYTDQTTDLYSLSETTMAISIRIPKCKIEVGGNFFEGSYISERYPHEKIWFEGNVSKDRMMLKRLTFRSSYDKEGYTIESEISHFVLLNIPISHSSLPAADGFCKFDKDISSVEVYEYRYTKTSSGRHSDYSLTKTFIRVNTENLPDLEDPFRFKIKLNMDGPPSYVLHVEDLSQDDPYYSFFLSERQSGEIQVEPNSVALYKNDEGLDEASIAKLKSTLLWLSVDFSHKKGIKVLERTNMDKMIQEIELGESGLTTEESKVRSDRLMIEEVALLVRTDLRDKYIEYKILSKEKATKITVFNLNENNFDFANWAARSKSMKLVLDYLEQD